MRVVSLHVPGEPAGTLERWRRRLRLGEPVHRVVLGPDGVAAWYWDQWQALERAGVDAGWFTAVARDHARELGLWLRGERTHQAVATSLVGRLERRLPVEQFVEPGAAATACVDDGVRSRPGPILTVRATSRARPPRRSRAPQTAGHG